MAAQIQPSGGPHGGANAVHMPARYGAGVFAQARLAVPELQGAVVLHHVQVCVKPHEHRATKSATRLL
jgi:hypothetical protein